MKHRVQVTVSDPNHSMVSKRNEKIQKFVRISGDQSTAVARARTHFKNQGYRVHDAEHVGHVNEGAQQLLRKYMPGYAKKQIDKKMDAEKFGRTDVDKDANYWRYKKVQDKLKKEEATWPGTPEYKAKFGTDKEKHELKFGKSDVKKLKPYGYRDDPEDLAKMKKEPKTFNMKEEAEQIDEKIVHTRIWEAWTQGNRNPQRGVRVGDKVRSYDFPGMHDDHYIEGHVVADTPHTYHIRVNRVVRGGKEIPISAHMQHVEAPKGRGMFSNAYAVHKIMAKQQSVSAAPTEPMGAAKTFNNRRRGGNNGNNGQ